VLAPEIAAVARPARAGGGTGHGAGGGRHTVSGKTGTGDHRYVVHAKNGVVVESRVVSGAASFIFLLDDRYFGTVTAYVPGSEAARFHFTSALPVRILGHLLPTLDRLSAPPATQPAELGDLHVLMENRLGLAMQAAQPAPGRESENARSRLRGRHHLGLCPGPPRLRPRRHLLHTS